MIRYYFINLGAAISQVIHAVFGGHSQVAVSGKVGYKSIHSGQMYWKVIMAIIDFAFFPIDGKEHCLQTYHKNTDESYTRGLNSDFWFGLMCMVILPFCLAISLLSWPIYITIKFIKWLTK